MSKKIDKITTANAPEEATPVETVFAGEALGFQGGEIRMVPIDQIDISNDQYMFRLDLRTGPLERSLRTHGLQVPVILKARGRGERVYQIISGFRRITAASRLGWKEIGAVVRNDLGNDEDAFKAAVLENTSRKTYSDIDRALVIFEYRARGLGEGDDVPMEVLGVTQRQQRNLLSLLQLPKAVQKAIDDPEQVFSATHGLALKQLASKYEKLNFGLWVKAVNKDELSVAKLKRAVNKEFGQKTAESFSGLFRNSDTDFEKGVVRFSPVKVDVGKMSDEEKVKLRGELEAVLGLLG